MSDERVRVLLVDDSHAFRGAVTDQLEQERDLHIVGSVTDGAGALTALRNTPVDVVLLDVEMPGMDGLTVLPQIVRDHPQARVIMVSTLTRKGAATTLQALQLGAVDFVEKPSAVRLTRGAEQVRDELVAKIRALGRRVVRAPSAPPPKVRSASAGGGGAARVLLVGASTGGPAALTEFLGALGADFSAPILLVQHMPPVFTRLLAERFQRDLKRPAAEAIHGEPVERGRIYVAPGAVHMLVREQRGREVLELSSAAPECGCRPAFDPLLRSAAEVYGHGALAVVLSGMGDDGSRGADVLCAAGGRVFAQDEASSVVWGMPGAIVRAGLASRIEPPAALGRAVREAMRT